MKNIKSHISAMPRVVIAVATFSAFVLAGCKDDFLDKQPLDALSSATFWRTESDAKLALTGVYYLEGTESAGAKQQYSFWNQDTYLRVFEATTDNGFEKDNNVTDFNDGNMTSANPVIAALWANAYLKIAKCNNFLENIDQVDMDDSERAQMIAEVRMIRAYDYFNLAFYWGDVPLVTKVLTVDEANSVSRTPKQDVMDFVISELSAAATDLPITRPANEKGRITKGGALAILGRVQMAQYLWDDAKATYKQIMDLGVYSIDPRFKELFEDGGEDSPEDVLQSVRMQDVYGNSILLSCLGFTWGGYHHYSPYNELVEDFECIDGKTIDQSPLYDPDHPYDNRDPRLLKTFFVDRVTTFKGTLFVSDPDSSATKYPDQLTRRPWSGYMVKKFCDEGYDGDVRRYGNDFTMVRYAEVLLSYLETNIESGSAITQQLLDETINKVRGRAEISMPPVTETDPAKLRTLLRRERRVEFAWEGLRLFDLFRWKIADQKLSGKFHGMKLCTAAEAPNYTKFPVDANGYYFCEEDHFRPDVDYQWPIPQAERDVNPNLTQNPGYSAD